MAEVTQSRMTLAEATELTKTPKLLRELLKAAVGNLAIQMVDMPLQNHQEQAGIIKGVRKVLAILDHAEAMVRAAQQEAEVPELDMVPAGFLSILMKPNPPQNGSG